MSHSLQMLLFDFLDGEVVLENAIVNFAAHLWLFPIAVIDWVAAGFASCCVLSEVSPWIFIW